MADSVKFSPLSQILSAPNHSYWETLSIGKRRNELGFRGYVRDLARAWEQHKPGFPVSDDFPAWVALQAFIYCIETPESDDFSIWEKHGVMMSALSLLLSAKDSLERSLRIAEFPEKRELLNSVSMLLSTINSSNLAGKSGEPLQYDKLEMTGGESPAILAAINTAYILGTRGFTLFREA
jgi:hypothetical protein